MVAVTAKKHFFLLWWKTLIKLPFLLKWLKHVLKHPSVYIITFIPCKTLQAPSRVKIKTSRKIYNTFVRTTTPSSSIGLIWKLLLLPRRHKNLHRMNTLPPTYSGMNGKQQALFLLKQNQKHSKRAPLLHTVRICFLWLYFCPFVLLFNMPSFRFF